MFGKMSLTEIVKMERREPLESAVAKLMETTDGGQIARWMQFPNALLLFVLVPDDAESGAVYLLDRKSGTWYMLDFDDEKYGGYSEADFECLMNACRFARLVERPMLLETCEWRIAPGSGPELISTLPQRSQPRPKKNLTTAMARA
jgi:hypothetical protein